MCGATAEHQRNRDPGEPGPAREAVEEEFQQAGICGFVCGTGEYDEISLADLCHEIVDVLVAPVEDRRAECCKVDDQLGFRARQLRGHIRCGAESSAAWFRVADDDSGRHDADTRLSGACAPNGTEALTATGAGCSHSPRRVSSGSTPSPNQYDSSRCG